MLTLDARPNDNAQFLDIASHLIDGAVIANRLTHLWVVHVDHWFGERWLGFHGKLLGVAGVRNRKLTGKLVIPPFHPNRVQSVRRYEMIDGVYEPRDLGWRTLHGKRSSQDNLNRIIFRNGIYAWFSGNTTETSKGVVMVYVVKDSSNAAWYTMFEPKPDWRMTRNVGIAARKVREFMDIATANSVS